jgi:tetratricopeptide (TPR) repeat protein
MKKIISLFLFFICISAARSQQKVTVKEYKKTFTTYPFSDPDPIPNFAKIYPYYRFDGYTNKSVQKDWKIVELENEYIKVLITPEIGGKIWTAIEKSTGQEFLYYNHVVKFRNVSMRGPWTNGGIEANFGIIGHTPNVATPVDYTIINKPDGSVSCVIGVLDLLTRTTWRLDINLEKDKAYFTTNAFWYNPTSISQPYYHWMNAGIKSAGNLQFVNPGTKYISHEGEPSSWPVSENGTDLSFYEKNNFGGYKSYHVIGRYSGFYGGYWHDDDFGMGHYASYDGKAGKKVWLWGLSGQGEMWEKLLSDKDGQEVEVQSGRLFNQPQGTSSQTPFKNKGFLPHTTDKWTEYWFPAVKTKGIVNANNYGTLNVKRENGWLKIYFQSLQPIEDDITITEGSSTLYSKKLNLKPLQLYVDSIKDTNIGKSFIASIGKDKLVYNSDPNADVIARPQLAPADIDWTTAYGLYVQGKEEMDKRRYPLAESKLREALKKEKYLSPALVDLAAILIRKREYQEALELTKRALSVNTYDDGANYYYGIVNMLLGNGTDAKEGLDIAAMGMEYRSAAYTTLSEIHLKEGNYKMSEDYARKSIDFNRYAMSAYQVLAVSYRLQQDNDNAKGIIDSILKLDPLNHFAHYEKYLLSGGKGNTDEFKGMIRNEMPHETYLELAIWYHSVGRDKEAIDILKLSPSQTEVSYWLAYLQKQAVNASDIDDNLVFPFRPETAVVLEKLIESNDSWTLKYHLALIEWHMNHLPKVKELFSQIGAKSDYAPFYAARARLYKNDSTASAQVLSDIQRAIELDPKGWRYGADLVTYYYTRGDYGKSLAAGEKYYNLDKDNYLVGMLYAQSLIANEKYAEAKKVMTSIYILPNEGATDGRDLYKESVLMLAVNEMKKKNYSKALAYVAESRKWPESLGVGRPYDSDIDERLEDWMAYTSYSKLGNKKAAKEMLDKILKFDYVKSAYGRHISESNHLVSSWAFKAAGDAAKAGELMKLYSGEEGREDENYRIIKRLE